MHEVKLRYTSHPSPLLVQDLAALRRQGGSDSVHLRLRFKRGLHPFFPPRVELMGPRFQGPVLGALCSHPLLQLAFWDPWMRQQELLELLKAFLQVCLHEMCCMPSSAVDLHVLLSCMQA